MFFIGNGICTSSLNKYIYILLIFLEFSVFIYIVAHDYPWVCVIEIIKIQLVND